MKDVRLLLATLVFVATLVPTAVVAFFVVVFLAGPHSDVLPRWLQPAVVVLGWIGVIVIPLVAARRTWRRLPRTGR